MKLQIIIQDSEGGTPISLVLLPCLKHPQGPRR